MLLPMNWDSNWANEKKKIRFVSFFLQVMCLCSTRIFRKAKRFVKLLGLLQRSESDRIHSNIQLLLSKCEKSFFPN